MFFPPQSTNNLSYPQMETAWRSVSNSGGASDGDGAGEGGDAIGGQNGDFTNHAWDNWDIGSTITTHPPTDATRYDWSNHDVCDVTAADSATRGQAASVVHALLLGVTNDNMNMNIHRNNSGHRIPDPHMMCLKLGKRHYFENGVVPDRRVAAESSGTKRGKPPYSYYVSDNTTVTTTGAWPESSAVTVVSSPATVPRCQVEGCHVALTNAKEYYRRHKVCEVHSKSPKVVVLGLQQRFCQQCSRFHGVTEFDEAKRSCRRRLEGHNQRRRKGTLSHSHENNLMMKGRFRTLSTLSPSPPPLKPGCALSLLSSPKTETWISSNDLSSRCSAALCELIAENRATTVFGHIWDQNTSHQPMLENTINTIPNIQIWDRLNDADNTTMTLDLMQDPTSDFRFLSMKEKSKNPEECNDYCWSAYGGTNVV